MSERPIAFAFYLAWLTLGAASIFVLAAAFSPIVGLTPACPGCTLCGTTRAFAAIARGDLAGAIELNWLSPVLFVALALNGAGALGAALVRQLAR